MDLIVDRASCSVKPKKLPKKKPKSCPVGGGVPGSPMLSFEAGTEVDTPLGKRPIEDLQVGDEVVSRDAFTGQAVARPVKDLFRRTAPGVVHLKLEAPSGRAETLHVTSEHPLFALGRGWTEVRRLGVGDEVLSEGAGSLRVADIEVLDRPTLVYNFEVAQDHSYFAGSEGAWAHNAPGWFWQSLLQNSNTPNNVRGWINQELNRGRD